MRLRPPDGASERQPRCRTPRTCALDPRPRRGPPQPSAHPEGLAPSLPASPGTTGWRQPPSGMTSVRTWQEASGEEPRGSPAQEGPASPKLAK